MNRYEKYKDSGIEWIGQIPEHWEVRRLKNIGSAQNGLTYSPIDVCDENQGILVLRSSNIQDGKLAFDDNVYVFVNKVPTNLLVYKGDIIICSRNGSASLVGKSALVTDDISACFGAFMMRFRSNEDYRYTYNLLTAAITQYKQLFSTSTINQLTIGIFSGLAMPFTRNKEEQQQIADFLDVKCAEVDELIALQEKMIDELKVYKQSVITEAVTKGLNPDAPLKDSGIEWIGQIPEHWSVRKVKHLANIKSGDSIVNNLISKEGDYEVYGGNGLMGYYNKFNVSGKSIIIGRVGALCGNIRFINEPKYISDNALILKCNTDELYPYMTIILSAANLNSLNISNAQPLITGTKVMNVIIPFPPIEEQQQIADYLDTKCAEIDEMTSIKQQKIEQLKEYKKSIIYEYVTGKKQVNIE